MRLKRDLFELLPGTYLGFTTSGTGGDTLILLHGFGASAEEWSGFQESFPAALAKTVALDLIGHGSSASPGWPDYSVNANAAAVARFIDAKAIERPVIVGHSLGGVVALAAARVMQHGQNTRPKALVLIATPVYRISLPRFIEAFRSQSLMGVLARLLPIRTRVRVALRELIFDSSKISRQTVEQYARYLDDPAVVHGMRMTARQLDLEEYDKLTSTYGELNLPILVVGGDSDPVVPRQSLERFVKSVGNATLVMVPECGHLLLDECPAAVEEAIRRFLSALK